LTYKNIEKKFCFKLPCYKLSTDTFSPPSKRYAPYSDGKVSFLSNMLKERWMPSLKYVPHLLCFGLGAAAVAIANYIKEVSCLFY